MKRTGALPIIVAFVVGGAAGFGVNAALTALGQPTFHSAVTLPLFLVLLGVATLLLAIPVRRAVNRGGRVDPFRAVRVLVLAKASAILGAVFAGIGVGLIVYVVTRPATSSLGSLAEEIGTGAAGLLLTVLALIAENLCAIRKEDDDEPTDPEPGATPAR